MIGQIFSAAALVIPCNMMGGCLGICGFKAKLPDRRESIDSAIFGIIGGIIPSTLFEGIRGGLHLFAPKLISWVPFPLGLVARIVYHLAVPVLGLFALYYLLPSKPAEELENFGRNLADQINGCF